LDTIENTLRQYANDLGFCELGFAEAEPFDEEMEHYKAWLDAGYNASMHYMANNLEKRQDVLNILPGARTVLVAAFNYFTDARHPAIEPGSDFGKISRYGWGDDYHEILLPRLKQLAEKIAELVPGTESRSYFDTGSTLDKQWAVRAGIGWQGKNSTVISPKHGSWIFLGLIITTAKLHHSLKIKDHCGTCSLCLSACPTQAIVEPHVVDARKCLSYWTIEAKPDMEIPPEIASKSEGWLFGCDICQEICPWNKKEKPTEDKSFYPRNNETVLTFKQIDEMTQEEFSKRFKLSPIKRSKLAGLKRNADAVRKYFFKI
jgi:epoxyqueuosine reductase